MAFDASAERFVVRSTDGTIYYLQDGTYYNSTPPYASASAATVGPTFHGVSVISPGSGVVAGSDGLSIPIDSLAQTLGYTGSNLTTITVSYRGNTYVQTLTYSGSTVTAISQWVKQ